MNHSIDEQPLDAEAAGEILHLKPSTLLTWARSGKMRYIRIGRSVRFRYSDIESLIREGEQDASESVPMPSAEDNEEGMK